MRVLVCNLLSLSIHYSVYGYEGKRSIRFILAAWLFKKFDYFIASRY